jgi:hypothetical protein
MHILSAYFKAKPFHRLFYKADNINNFNTIKVGRKGLNKIYSKL